MACSKGRKIYFDFLRIISILLVMFNHTGNKGFIRFTSLENRGGSYYFLIACSIIVSIAVPIFFMISGALLIPKEENLRTLYEKRILKHMVILLTFSFVSWRYYSDWNMRIFDWLYFFRQLWSSNWATSYWFLYSYVSYLVLLPLIRLFAKALSDSGFKYLIVIYLSIQTLYIIDWIVWRGSVSYNGSLSFFIMENNFFYPLLGVYIDSHLHKVSKKTIGALAVFAIISLTIMTLLTSWRCVELNIWEENRIQYFYGTYTSVIAAFVFLASKVSFTIVGDRWKKINWFVTYFGSLSFGIMLIEHICRKRTAQLYDFFVQFFPPFLSCWMWILSAYLMRVAIVSIMKMVPCIKRLI